MRHAHHNDGARTDIQHVLEGVVHEGVQVVGVRGGGEGYAEVVVSGPGDMPHSRVQFQAVDVAVVRGVGAQATENPQAGPHARKREALPGGWHRTRRLHLLPLHQVCPCIGPE